MLEPRKTYWWEKTAPNLICMIWSLSWTITTSMLNFIFALTNFDPSRTFWILLSVAFLLTQFPSLCLPFVGLSKTLVKCLAWILQSYPVELYSMAGNTRYTICYRLPDKKGKMHAPVYWWSQTGDVALLPDGKIDPKSETLYINYWLPLNKSDRLQHLLAYGPCVKDDPN